MAKPSGAAHTAGTVFSTCMAVATLADRTCSSMLAARVKLAKARKWVRMEGSPSMVNVQPCSGLGQCFGYSPPTVQSVSISMSVSPRRRPDQFHRWPGTRRCGADVSGGGDPNRVPSDESAYVGAVLAIGIHPRADDLQVWSVVDDRRDHLCAYRAGAPWDDAVPRRLRVFDDQVRRHVGSLTPVLGSSWRGPRRQGIVQTLMRRIAEAGVVHPRRIHSRKGRIR